jgi:cytochrome d ubiquinol oxidase subunit II
LTLKLDGEIVQRARAWAHKIWFIFFALLLIAIVWGIKNYLYGIKALPLLFVALTLTSAVEAFMLNKKEKAQPAFLASCGTIAFLMLGIAFALFPNMVPCSNDPARSLTVFNSSSSQLTLTAMLVITLIGMPLVLAYTVYIHRVFRGKINVK